MEQNLLLLFERPTEPLFLPKGGGNINFHLPQSYLPEIYQPLHESLLQSLDNNSLNTIHIEETEIPQLDSVFKLRPDESFSLYTRSHRKIARQLIDLFLSITLISELLSVAAYYRERVNSQMFSYALAVALLNRPDTKHLKLPHFAAIFPDKFVNSQILQRAKDHSHFVPKHLQSVIDIPLNYTATDVDPEHRIAYWREDMGANLHHWHWHLVYPMEGPYEVVNKDRRGELFYYMHHQIVSRYNIERLCNNLGIVRPFEDFDERIPEAYFSKLNMKIASRSWAARPANLKISDLNRPPHHKFTIHDLKINQNNLFNAIDTRHVVHKNGSIIYLDDFSGIDMLGNMVEASILSPNPIIYGDLHNNGHEAFAFIHDPDHRYLEVASLMGETTTAMRDPIFYRWHKHIDEIFQRLKDKLPSYTTDDLIFPGVTITDVRISTPGANVNTLNTHWTKSEVDVSRGMDFASADHSFVFRLQHLNHENFEYDIQVNNQKNSEVTGVVRIFVAPKYSASGDELSFNDQRMLMIEMDKFTTKLQPGENLIVRNSTQSAFTIPFEETFRNLNKNRPNDTDYPNYDKFNFCGCGWPHHLLVPKGTKEGYPMELFIMISDYDLDKVEGSTPEYCENGVSFCGLRNHKYPDARPMGYPFDRIGKSGINNMNDFLTPNMKMQQITVKFSDTIKPAQPFTEKAVC